MATNLAANYLGRAWVAVMSLLFIPFYTNLMGIEAYGLVGFYLTLLAIALVWEFGASTTLLRDLAQAVAEQLPAERMRESVRTLEALYWGATALVGAAVVAGSGHLAQWVRAEQLSQADVRAAVALMGVALLFQGPLTLYQGGLQGLDRQVLMNFILAAGATLRGVATVLVLWLVSPSVVAFFAAQAAISCLQTIAMAAALWSSLPPSRQRPVFRREMVASVWRFTAGTTAVSITAVVLMQTDKVLLSRILPLREFGYYSIAWQVAASLAMLAGPVYASVFPRLAALAARAPRDALAALYDRACQVLAVLLLPAAAVVAAFSTQLLAIWTGSEQTAAAADTLVSVLVVGSALNGLYVVPWGLQLAHGWTRLALTQNVISIVVLVPGVIWAAQEYGAIGAAAMWPVVNLGYLLIGTRLMHRKILPEQRPTWYRRDFLAPVAAVAAVAAMGRVGQPELPEVLQLAWIGSVFIVAVAAVVAATGSASWLLPRLARTLPPRRRSDVAAGK